MARGLPTACATARRVFGFKDVEGKELQKSDLGLFALATSTRRGAYNSNCQCGVMHTQFPALYVRGVGRVKGPSAVKAGSEGHDPRSVFDLLEDVRTAPGFDLVRRLLNQRDTVKARDHGIDRVFDVLDGSWTQSGFPGLSDRSGWCFF